MYRDLVVGDLEHVLYFNCGRCSTPPHLFLIDFIIPWCIWPNESESLIVCISGVIHLVPYLGSRENASMLNVSRGSWARMWRELLGMLHMDFVSLMRRLFHFLMFETKKDAECKTYSMLMGIELRIFIFGCSYAGNSSKAMLYFCYSDFFLKWEWS